METRTRLTVDELTQIIASVFAYNEQEVVDVAWDIRDNTVAAEVVCESLPLKVRIEPERKQEDQLAKMTDDVLAKMHSR